MKKTLIIFTSLLLLSGCDVTEKMFGQDVPDFDTSYSISAEIDYGKLTACVDITRNDADNWRFSFTEPEYLSGIELTLDEDDVTVSLGELNISTEKNDIYRLIPDLIAESVNSLADIDKESITEQDGILTINTTVADKKVVITADNDGRLITLKCPYYNISVDFSGQTPLTAQPPAADDTDDYISPEILN